MKLCGRITATLPQPYKGPRSRRYSVWCRIFVFQRNYCAFLFFLSVLSAQNNSTPAVSSREEIHVMRSVRTSRTAHTDYCADSRTGFGDILFEDRYLLYSVSTGPDGAVVVPFGAQTGSGHTCFGKTADPNVMNFYAEIEIGGKAFRGAGKCNTLKSDFPERGLNVATCFLQLSALNDTYTGGLLTSNTLFSRNVLGDKSDPPGYVQSSIATLRLWKRSFTR
jgi:hypothetical protein